MSKLSRKSVVSQVLLCGAALSAILVSVPALAQTAPDPSGSADASETPNSVDDDIVVTGTLIRGIEPVGSPVISLNRDAVVATGATTINQLLSNIPQVASFNDVPLIGTGGNSSQLPILRPRIRNIGNNDAGASATLILIDGHRVVGAGLRQTTADPDIIPPGALERVEVIPDGGSSIYGADAVAGVINFITRRRFDGVEVDAKFGFGDNFYQIDAYATVGKDWGTGSAYVSYNYSMSDDILGRDRDYIRRYDYVAGRLADLSCAPGNITIGTTIYALPSRTPGAGNRCDTTDLATAFPKTKRHSVFGAISQDFGDSVKVDVRAFYTRRVSTMNNGPFRSESTTVPSTNFYWQPIGAETSQQVSFSWEPALGARSVIQESALDEWGITPTITWDLNDNWQFRGLANYGQSMTKVSSRQLNNTLLLAALRSSNPNEAINPYNIAATQNRALIDQIANWQNYGENKQTLLNFRGILDGTLFALGGNDVRLAAGVEYIRESVAPRTGNSTIGGEGALPIRVRASRNVKAAFGELFVPIVGEGNREVMGIHSLSLSLSGRYDDYSDVGSTFNPKVGVTLEPVSGLKLRGNWGTSFNAPSLADTIGSPDGSISISFPANNNVFGVNPNFPIDFSRGAGQAMVSFGGAFPGVIPQKATTYSFGFDLQPDFAPGLRASLTYYNVDFKDQIALPPTFLPNFYSLFTNLYIMYPTREQVEAYAANYPTGAQDISVLYAAAGEPAKPPVYILRDTRRRNLGRLKVSGLDFSLNYARPTGFGSMDCSFSGTYELNRETQAFNGAPTVDALVADNSYFRFATSVGANIGDHLRAQVTWNHTHGYNLTPQAAFNFQNRVDSFNVINLFARYDVKGEKLFNDLSFTLNVNNLSDAEPPLLQGFSLVNSGFINGNTLGRVVQIGVNKKF